MRPHACILGFGALLLLSAPFARAADLALGDASPAAIGDIVSVPLRVESAPNDAAALGTDIHFDPDNLQFAGFERGDLTIYWTLMDARMIAPGILRLGAVEPDAGLASGTSGTLAQLQFRLIGPWGSALALNHPVGDIAQWSTRGGIITGVSTEPLSVSVAGPYVVGDTVQAQVWITDPPNAVNAFGFDLTFDPAILALTSVDLQSLPDGWQHAEYVQPEPGRLRFGGYAANATWPSGVTAPLATLAFDVLDDTNSDLMLRQLVADMRHWRIAGARVAVRRDTDGDGLPDDFEQAFGLDPEDPSDATADPDGDGLTNIEEFRHGSHPHLADSDGDGVADGDEVADGFDPANSGDCPQNACGSVVIELLKMLESRRTSDTR